MVESTGKRRNYQFLQFYLKLLDVWAFWLSMPHNGWWYVELPSASGCHEFLQSHGEGRNLVSR